jgi:hypothetical protein
MSYGSAHRNSCYATPIVGEAQSTEVLDFKKYQELPPPIIKYLEENWGNWLKHFEIGQKYREDFGGYAVYVKVPRAFSTEWEKRTYQVYDNETRKMTGQKEVIAEDIRWRSMKDMHEAVSWLALVKKNLITKAFQKGMQLPSTNVKYESPQKTVEDFERELAGVT